MKIYRYDFLKDLHRKNIKWSSITLASIFIILTLTTTALMAQEPSPAPTTAAPQIQKPSPAATTETLQYQLQVQGTPRQGSILFVTVPGTKPDQKGECTWRNMTRPLSWQGKSLGIILPVALDARQGGYTIKITVKNADGSAAGNAERKIDVVAYTYGTQQLWLSQEQLNRYDDPQSDRDNDAIHKALSFYTPGITWSRQFIWPINSYISTKFGLKRFYNNDPEPEFHRGFDLPGSIGTPIKASQNGIVRFAREKLLLHGTAVVIDHGRGIGTLYLHMNSLKVKPGQKVEQGQIIGTVGASGVSTGPHLHWAAYSFDQPIDPRLLFSLPSGWIEK
ncbi:MAG: M23 family metallopeptidase [Candidatus Xenobiia bacterium LiM19]